MRIIILSFKLNCSLSSLLRLCHKKLLKLESIPVNSSVQRISFMIQFKILIYGRMKRTFRFSCVVLFIRDTIFVVRQENRIFLVAFRSITSHLLIVRSKSVIKTFALRSKINLQSSQKFCKKSKSNHGH